MGYAEDVRGGDEFAGVPEGDRGRNGSDVYETRDQKNQGADEPVLFPEGPHGCLRLCGSEEIRGRQYRRFGDTE